MSMAIDPLSKLVRDAVAQAIHDTGLPLRNRLMQIEAAAEYMGMSSDSLRDLAALGKIKNVKILGRRLMFDVKDLDAAIEDSK